jgi:large subunit ribosomal protein L22e
LIALQPKAASTTKTAGKPAHRFVVDYSVPAGDNVFDAAGFEKFLHDRIKVDGKPGQLGDAITLKREGELGVFFGDVVAVVVARGESRLRWTCPT